MLQPKEILEAALKLEPAERARIANELLESIEEPEAVELSPAWKAELQRRIQRIESGDATFVPAEQVFEEAEAFLRAQRAGR
jgi:putative addiction module component (TIGR02574 family)